MPRSAGGTDVTQTLDNHPLAYRRLAALQPRSAVRLGLTAAVISTGGYASAQLRHGLLN